MNERAASDLRRAFGARDLPFDPLELSYIRLHVFVLMQHGYPERALAWLDLLYAEGDRSEHLTYTRAAALFLAERWQEASAALQEADRLYPIERFGDATLDERQKLRLYMRARCQFELRTDKN